jgi:hypothetical protein
VGRGTVEPISEIATLDGRKIAGLKQR